MATKKIEPFEGFSPATTQFFKDLKENNYKEWFETHRSIYENEVLARYKSLVATLSPTMHNIDTLIDLRPQKVLSRIYRDVRFSKNKDPYKTGIWMSFQHSGTDWMNFPGFFFEMNHERYIYGMGLYAPKRNIMDAVRDSIAYDAAEFKQKTQKTVLGRGFVIEGEEYKRPIPNELNEYYQPWMQKKSIWVAKTMPLGEELYSAQFAETLREDFVALEWLYNFFKDSQP